MSYGSAINQSSMQSIEDQPSCNPKGIAATPLQPCRVAATPLQPYRVAATPLQPVFYAEHIRPTQKGLQRGWSYMLLTTNQSSMLFIEDQP
jgi:hypothetical protein